MKKLEARLHGVWLVVIGSACWPSRLPSTLTLPSSTTYIISIGVFRDEIYDMVCVKSKTRADRMQ